MWPFKKKKKERVVNQGKLASAPKPIKKVNIEQLEAEFDSLRMACDHRNITITFGQVCLSKEEILINNIERMKAGLKNTSTFISLLEKV